MNVDLGAPGFFALALISVGCGFAISHLFRALSDQDAVQRSKRLLIAHLLEFRLFSDEPALIVRAQWSVLVESFRLVRWLLRPALITALPMFLLFTQLDAIFSNAPLVTGEDSVVTVQFQQPPAATALDGSEAILVDTPPVRVPATGQVSWRFRPVLSGPGQLMFRYQDLTFTKSIVAGTGMHYLSEKRAGTITGFLMHPTERPLPAGPVRWIEIRYPRADIFGLNWIVWFLAISGVTALLPKRLIRLGTGYPRLGRANPFRVQKAPRFPNS